MSDEIQIWLEGQKRAVHLIKYLNQLSKMVPNLPDTAAKESCCAILTRAEKSAHDLQRALYRLKRNAVIDET